jgi:Bacterial Ig domain
MNKSTRIFSHFVAIIFFNAFPAKLALAVSLPECITNSRDANNIIRSAPCGIYGVVNSRQTNNATGTTLDIAIQYMVHLPPGAPKAIVMLFTGSSGNAGIVGDDTTHVVGQAGSNFLVRSAQLFAEEGFLAVTIDRPEPLPSDSYDQYRISPRHANDIVAVLLEVNELYDASRLNLFFAGTSRGALSVVAQNNLAVGSLLSSPVNAMNSGLWVGGDAPEPRLLPSFAVVPIHVLAHAQDGCSVSAAANSKKLQTEFHAAGVHAFFNSVDGGFEIDIDPCEAKAFHGFLGIETTAVKKITDRMDYFLKKQSQDFRGNIKPELIINAPFSVSTAADTAVTIDLAGLALDANGDALSYSLPHPISNRGGILNLNGSMVEYSPPAGFTNRTDGFVFQVSDGKGGKTNGVILVAVGVP